MSAVHGIVGTDPDLQHCMAGMAAGGEGLGHVLFAFISICQPSSSQLKRVVRPKSHPQLVGPER